MRGFGNASITNNSRAVAEFRGDRAALDRLLAEARELLRRRTAHEWFKELSGPDRTDESRTVALGYLIEQRGLTEILCGRIGHAEFAFTGCEDDVRLAVHYSPWAEPEGAFVPSDCRGPADKD
jgi:hypothetical protein